MTTLKTPKPKKCKAPGCGKPFKPAMTTQKVCSIACAKAMAKDPKLQKIAARAITKQAREDLKERREKLKSKADHMREAQAEFNAFIRLRDASEPCICCGSYGAGEDWLTGGKWDAGHFLGRGAYPELRFDEDNCHKQLKTCNAGSSKYAAKGRTVAQGYRERLIQKIGQERVERLEGPHVPRRYTIEDLQAIKALYRQKLKDLRRAAA
ncbi:TPA: recombination protein NinG [Pseudomonas putida]